MQISNLIQFIGGLLIFLFAMDYVRNRLEKASGDTLRSAINRFIKDRVRAFIIGVVSTLIMESSGAATVMFVGFTGVGLLELSQAIALTAGATVGTTLFVMILAHFISYELTNFSFILVVIGFLLRYLRKRGTVKYISEAIIGLGILFLGVYFMIKSTYALGSSEFFTQQITLLSKSPLLAIAVATAFTALIHSSAGTIAIALSLTTLNVIDLEAAIPIIIGANIGTCFTAILASINTNVDGKRVAWAHLFIKLIGAIAVFPFIPWYAKAMEFLVGNLNYQVAFSHFFFNLFNAFVVLCFLEVFQKLVVKLIPKEENENSFSVKFLDNRALETPQVAFGNVVREIMRMADICQEMLNVFIVAFEKNDKTIIDKLEEMDDKVDTLNEEIKFYLAKISQSELTSQQAKREMNLINVNNNLEIIGDIISKTIGELAYEKITKGVEFSQAGWADIKKFYCEICANFNIAVNSFATNNKELARKAIRNKKKIGQLEEELKAAHFMRLTQDMKESLLTSSTHLELLGHLRRLNAYITRVAFIVEDRHGYQKENGKD